MWWTVNASSCFDFHLQTGCASAHVQSWPSPMLDDLLGASHSPLFPACRPFPSSTIAACRIQVGSLFVVLLSSSIFLSHRQNYSKALGPNIFSKWWLTSPKRMGDRTRNSTRVRNRSLSSMLCELGWWRIAKRYINWQLDAQEMNEKPMPKLYLFACFVTHNC